jgi:hypothetical protein
MNRLPENSDLKRPDSVRILSALRDESLDTFVTRLVNAAKSSNSHIRGIFDGIVLGVDQVSKEDSVVDMFVRKKQRHIKSVSAALLQTPDEHEYEDILLLLRRAETVKDVVFLLDDRRLMTKTPNKPTMINRDDRLEYARWIVEGALESIQKQGLGEGDRPINGCIESFIMDWEERFLHLKK